MTLAVWLLRVLAVLWAATLLLVVVGAFLPRLPVAGFLGSFVTGQYPVHVGLAALAGIGLGAAAWGTGATRVGVGVGAVGMVATVGAAVVLGSLATTAHREGTRIDWWRALTVLDQPDGHPDRTETFDAARGLRLDLYLPSGPGPHPVIVWAHGGSWVRGERNDRTAANRWFAEHGWAVVALDYRLPPPGPVGEGQRRDVACALSWVAGAGRDHGLDPGHAVLAGQSAGATLALSTAAGLRDGSLPGAQPCDGPAPPPPWAVVAWYPVTDLRLVDPSLQDAVLGGRPERFPERTRAASPIDLVGPELPPTMVVMGSADHFVFPSRVRAYDRALRAADVPGRMLEVPFADHVFDYPFGSPGGQLARPAVLRFLDAPRP